MRYSWANTVLLVFVLAEAVTGLFGLVAGSPDRAIWNDIHLAVAFGIMGVLGWKTALALRSLRLPSRRRPRKLSLLLAFLLLASLVLGIYWSNVGYWSYAGITGMSWHIYFGVATVPLLVYHSWRYTARFRVGYRADRRAALRLIGIVAAGAAAWAISETAARAFSLPGAGRRFTGSYERHSFSGNAFPTTSWLNDNPTAIDTATWRLRVDGAVAQPLELALGDLSGNGSFRTVEIAETLDCTGGWYSTQLWRGVHVADLLRDAGVGHDAQSVTFTSVTGYYRRASLNDVEHYLLATHVGGEPLSHRHGAPLRLVAPGRRGFEWVKWVSSVTVNTTPKWLQPPLPLR